MKKFTLTNKKIPLVIIMIALSGLGYFGVVYYKSGKDSKEPPVEQQKPEEERANEQNEDKVQDDTEDKENTTEDSKLDYKITNLNKRDGDIFSIPDEVTFSISPSVDKSKVTLTSDDGTILYTGEAAGSEGKFTVFPSKKIAEGNSGTLLVEGFKGSDVVIFQKIKVIF